jgi:hypothetical protein
VKEGFPRPSRLDIILCDFPFDFLFLLSRQEKTRGHNGQANSEALALGTKSLNLQVPVPDQRFYRTNKTPRKD